MAMTEEERKAKALESNRRYRAKNPEAVLARNRARYAANRERILARYRELYAQAPEKIRDRNRNSDAKMAELLGFSSPQNAPQELLDAKRLQLKIKRALKKRSSS